MKKGQDRFPPIEFRDYSVDLVAENRSNEQPQDIGAIDFDANKKLRDQQYEQTKDFNHHNAEEEEKDEDEDNEVKKSVAGEYQAFSVFKNKQKEDAKLEDFELIKTVGKGTFGKVF